MKTNRIISIIAAAALTLSVSAQQSEIDSSAVRQISVYDNYAGVSFGGGLNTMLYRPANGQQRVGGGFDMSLFYARFFNEYIGLGAGLNYAFANAYATYNFSETTTGLPLPGNPDLLYDLTTSFNNFAERQNVGVLSIPIEVLYRRPIAERWLLLCGLGLSIDFPIHGNCSSKGGTYTTTGAIPALGGYTMKDIPEQGFTTYAGIPDTRINNLAKAGVGLVVDAGVRYALKDHWGLYMGINFGYGFTNLLASAKTDPLLVQNTTDATKIDYHGTFDSNETAKANLIRFGVKVAVDFGWNDDDLAQRKAERLAREQAEADRLAAEAEAVRLAEQARLDSIAETVRMAEQARLDSIANAEQARLDSIANAKAKAIADSIAEADAERLAAEAEAARLAEQARLDSIAEAERIAREVAERMADLKNKAEGITIHFDIASSVPVFSDLDKATLDAVCQLMHENPDLRVEIFGHTDNIGDPEKNLRYFGRIRAEAVRDYMISRGVPAASISCVSKGDTEPIAPNDTPEGRAQNRRANLRLQ